jgi:hypothetical protein
VVEAHVIGLLLSRIPWGWRAAATLALLLGVHVTWSGWRAGRLVRERDAARAQVVAVAADRDRAEALADTTRYLADLFGMERDLWARRAVQDSLRADSLDRVLRTTSRARYQLAVTVDSLRAERTALLEAAADSTRRVRWEITDAAYTANVEVTIRRDSAHLALVVAVAPIAIDARLVCGAPRDGFRPAELYVEGPTWTTVTLGRLVQEPGVCNETVLRVSERGSWKLPAALGVAAGALAALLVGG